MNFGSKMSFCDPCAGNYGSPRPPLLPATFSIQLPSFPCTGHGVFHLQRPSALDIAHLHLQSAVTVIGQQAPYSCDPFQNCSVHKSPAILIASSHVEMGLQAAPNALELSNSSTFRPSLAVKAKHRSISFFFHFSKTMSVNVEF